MSNFEPQTLLKLHERKVRLLRAKPSAARASAATKARRTGGLACEVLAGDVTLLADQPVADGGDGSGPTPGQLMRAGLASCLVIGYVKWAAIMAVPIEDVEVELACELDARGQLDADADVPAGWQRIVYTVRIKSDADADTVRRLVAHADRVSPMLGSIDRSCERVCILEVVS